MSKHTSIAELRKMQVKDLLIEVRTQEHLVSKLRLGVKLQKEKDTARYTSEKRQLARMRTVLTEKQAEELLQKAAGRTVPVSKKEKDTETASPSKKS